MKANTTTHRAVALLAAAGFALSLAGSAAAADKGDPAHFNSFKKCTMCHKKESIGDQLAVWEKSPHAKAYEALAAETEAEGNAGRARELHKRAEKNVAIAKKLDPIHADVVTRGFLIAGIVGMDGVDPTQRDIATPKVTLPCGITDVRVTQPCKTIM